MATKLVENGENGMDLPNLCRAVADSSPMPMVGLGGPLHTIRYVNLAFCLLTEKSKDELIGTPFSGVASAQTNACYCLTGSPRQGWSIAIPDRSLLVSMHSTGHTQCGRCLRRTIATSALWSR